MWSRCNIALLISLSTPMLSNADWMVVSQQSVPKGTTFIKPHSESCRSPCGARIYTETWFADTVSVVNAKTSQVIETIKVGLWPLKPTISPDCKRIYVSNYFGKSVSVIDTSTLKVIGTIKVGKWPRIPAISPDSTTIFVSSHHGRTISVINTNTLNIIDIITVGENPNTPEISPNGIWVRVPIDDAAKFVYLVDLSFFYLNDPYLQDDKLQLLSHLKLM